MLKSEFKKVVVDVLDSYGVTEEEYSMEEIVEDLVSNLEYYFDIKDDDNELALED